MRARVNIKTPQESWRVMGTLLVYFHLCQKHGIPIPEIPLAIGVWVAGECDDGVYVTCTQLIERLTPVLAAAGAIEI